MEIIKGLAVETVLDKIDWTADRAFCKILSLQYFSGGITYLTLGFWRTEKSYDSGAEPILEEVIKLGVYEELELKDSMKRAVYAALRNSDRFTSSTELTMTYTPLNEDDINSVEEEPLV